MSLSKNFFDLDLDDEIVQEGTETGSLDFDFDNDEVTQESMFDSGFSNLRSGIANALKDTKYKVSNIVRGMLGKDMFTVSDDHTTTTIDSMGNGCKVVTRDGKGKMKVNFNNISLSEALRKLVELFKSPEHILEGAIDDIYYKSIYQEADDTEAAEVDDKLSPDQVDDFYGKLKDELGQDDDTGKEANENENTPTEEAPQSTDTLPEDFWYTKGNSAEDIGKPITDEDIANAEKELGYKLPESYKSVIKQQNGGRVNRCVFPYNGSCIEIDTLFGIDHDKPSLFETSFYVSEWGYPDIGLTVASTPSAGHDMVFLDYSECGKDGEPSVVVIDQELDYRKTKLAGNFGEFINKLVTRDEYDQSESPNDTSEEETPVEDEPTLESYVQEAFDTKAEAAKMLQRPEVLKEIANNIDDRFKTVCGSLVKPTEADLKENRDRAWNQIRNQRPEIILMMYAPKYYDELNKAEMDAMMEESRREAEEMRKKIMERRNNVNESYVQEADEPSDDDTVEEAIEKENTPDEEPRTEETIEEDLDMDFDFDFDAPPTSTEDALADSETPEGDDLSTFGTDTSDVQNEYDPKEIEILNKLIAAEGEAINDYFDASKDSHDSNARRLYSDIGHEERFHMEQLLFQKAQFTGEKYEPRDPEVKKEYEELLQLGMDDATAMHAAIDKKAMENSGPSDEGMSEEILEYSTDNILSMLHTTSILMEAGMYAYYHRADNTAKQYGIILEAYVVQEEVMNTAKAPKELKGTPNPFALLLKGFRAAVSALSTLTANIREKSEMNRINRNSRMEWLKKNGITGLFKSGKYFYFYNDTDNAFNMVIPVQYVDLLYRLSVDIGKKCGVTVTPQGYHGTIKNPIKYNSIEDGMNKIRSLNMTKTKVIVTDQNKDALVNEFFGYSDKKINVKVWNEEANRAIYESNNVYNKLMCFAMITGKYAQVTDQIMEVMKGLQGNMNSIYYKDRNAYNKYVGYMETIVKTYIKISQAATSDLSEMLSLDKEGVKDVTATRDSGGKLPEGTEDRRTSGALGDNRSNKKYAKTKK